MGNLTENLKLNKENQDQSRSCPLRKTRIIILGQTSQNRATRTFMDYDSTRQAMDGNMFDWNSLAYLPYDCQQEAKQKRFQQLKIFLFHESSSKLLLLLVSDLFLCTFYQIALVDLNFY